MKKNENSGFLLTLIGALAPDPKKVSEWVREIRSENPELSKEELVHCNINSYSKIPSPFRGEG